MGSHCTGTPLLVAITGDLFASGPPPPDLTSDAYWNICGQHKWAVHILLECYIGSDSVPSPPSAWPGPSDLFTLTYRLLNWGRGGLVGIVTMLAHLSLVRTNSTFQCTTWQDNQPSTYGAVLYQGFLTVVFSFETLCFYFTGIWRIQSWGSIPSAVLLVLLRLHECDMDCSTTTLHLGIVSRTI